jgi:hypothetical protein
MIYKSYKEIPNHYRKMILEETQEKRISSVPLIECNEMILEFQETEKENETLKNYEVVTYKNGAERVYKYDNAETAFIQLDRVIGFDEHDKSIVAVVKQAGKIIRAYVKGQYVEQSNSIYS